MDEAFATWVMDSGNHMRVASFHVVLPSNPPKMQDCLVLRVGLAAVTVHAGDGSSVFVLLWEIHMPGACQCFSATHKDLFSFLPCNPLQ